MNNVAGIDVSKGRAWYLFSVLLVKWWQNRFPVGHTGSELKGLADYLKSLDGETRVVMEHTGRYYEPVARFLHEEASLSARSIQNSSRTTGTTRFVRSRPMWQIPARLPGMGLDNWMELRQHTPMDTIRMQLKTLNRQQGLYYKTKTMMKNNLIALWIRPILASTPLFDSPGP